MNANQKIKAMMDEAATWNNTDKKARQICKMILDTADPEATLFIPFGVGQEKVTAVLEAANEHMKETEEMCFQWEDMGFKQYHVTIWNHTPGDEGC